MFILLTVLMSAIIIPTSVLNIYVNQNKELPPSVSKEMYHFLNILNTICTIFLLLNFIF